MLYTAVSIDSKTFDNLDDALRWLGIASAHDPGAGDGT